MRRDKYTSKSQERQFIYGLTPTGFDRRLFGTPGIHDQAVERFGSPHAMTCPTCGGTSFIPGKCPRCHGSGIDPFYIFERCLRCKGDRAVPMPCPNPDCQGGYVVIRY